MKNKIRENDYIKINVPVIYALQEKGITNYGAVLLYSKILSMADKTGYCTASNGYFADTILTGERNIKKYLQKLKEVNAITVFEDREDGYTKMRKIYPKIAGNGQSMEKQIQNQTDGDADEKELKEEKITDSNISTDAPLLEDKFNYYRSLNYSASINDEDIPRVVAIAYTELDSDLYDTNSAREKLIKDFTGGYYQAKNIDNITKLIDAVIDGEITAVRV
nr:helix-turn-helix domain-containing protein [uncultured Blautia sp.]